VDPNKSLGCPAILDVPAADQLQAVLPLALARGMLEAALERDTNRMVTTAVRGVDIVLLPTLANSEQTKARKRVMRLLAGVVQYANTYQSGGDAPSEQVLSRSTHEDSGIAHAGHDGSHRARWRLDRLDRRLVGRSRRRALWRWKTVYTGHSRCRSASAYKNVPATIPVGLHLELVYSISRSTFLSIEARRSEFRSGSREVVVRKPKVQDVVSLRLKLGAQWGREVPVYIAGVVVAVVLTNS